MDISGKIGINKKGFGRRIPQGRFEEVYSGKKPKDREAISPEVGQEEMTGLNDLDNNIMTRNFEQNLPLSPLKLEIKIEKTEKKLSKVREEIRANKILDIKDPTDDKRLKKDEERLKREILAYRQEYRKQGISYAVADTVNQAIIAVKSTVTAALSPKQDKNTQFAKILDKKLSRELGKRSNLRSEKVEYLLFQVEKLNARITVEQTEKENKK